MASVSCGYGVCKLCLWHCLAHIHLFIDEHCFLQPREMIYNFAHVLYFVHFQQLIISNYELQFWRETRVWNIFNIIFISSLNIDIKPYDYPLFINTVVFLLCTLSVFKLSVNDHKVYCF